MVLSNYMQSFSFTFSVLVWLLVANSGERSKNEAAVNVLVAEGVMYLLIFASIFLWPLFPYGLHITVPPCFSVFFLAQLIIGVVYFAVTHDSDPSEIFVPASECSNVLFCSIGVIMNYINAFQFVFISFLFLLSWIKEFSQDRFFRGGRMGVFPDFKQRLHMINMFLIIQTSICLIGYPSASTGDRESLPGYLMLFHLIATLITTMILSYYLFVSTGVKGGPLRRVLFLCLLITWVVCLVYVSFTFTTDTKQAFRTDYSCVDRVYCSAAVVLKVLDFIFVFVVGSGLSFYIFELAFQKKAIQEGSNDDEIGSDLLDPSNSTSPNDSVIRIRVF